MQSDKAPKKTRNNASEPAAASGMEKSAVKEKTTGTRTAKSALSRSEPVETASAKRHRKPATVNVPEQMPETASEQPISQLRAMSAIATADSTSTAVIDTVGLGPVGLPAVGVTVPAVDGMNPEVSQQRIHELAYQYWISEGQPHGKHHEHWSRAERELTAGR